MICNRYVTDSVTDSVTDVIYPALNQPNVQHVIHQKH